MVFRIQSHSVGNICVINWCELWYLLLRLKFNSADFGCERERNKLRNGSAARNRNVF